MSGQFDNYGGLYAGTKAAGGGGDSGPVKGFRNPGLLEAGFKGLARGGPAEGRQAYLVGEKGPEVFVPNQDGQIIPNHKLPDALKKKKLLKRADGGDVEAHPEGRPKGFRSPGLLYPATGMENLSGLAGGGVISSYSGPSRQSDENERHRQMIQSENERAEAKNKADRLRQEAEIKYHENVDWGARTDKLRAEANARADANKAQFWAQVERSYGKQKPDGKTREVPEHISKLAFSLLKKAGTNPQEAFSHVADHVDKTNAVVDQWGGYKGYFLADREKALGRPHTADEIKAIDRMGTDDPVKVANIISSLQERGAKPWEPGPTKPASGFFSPLYGTPWASTGKAETPPPLRAPQGFAPAQQSNRPPGREGESALDYIRRVNPRNDQLSPEEARVKFNQHVNEATGPGFSGENHPWVNWGTQNVPGFRDIVDPNTPLRRGARALWGAITPGAPEQQPPAAGGFRAPAPVDQNISFGAGNMITTSREAEQQRAIQRDRSAQNKLDDLGKNAPIVAP